MVKAKVRLDPLRGFRDLLPPESTGLTLLASIFAEEAERHGYSEVRPPTLERFELFALKSGEEIRRSMYVFHDKAGREVALRPEATASVARIYLRHLRGAPKPVRLYYIINCFRYEEPQKARYREFWQAGIELLGAPGLVGDFETVKLLLRFYERIGMSRDIVLKIGNTRIYRALFTRYNVEEQLQDHILHLMDKSLYDQAVDEVRSRVGEELASILSSLWRGSRSDTAEARELLERHGLREAAEAVVELEKLVSMLRGYTNTRIDVDLAFARGLAYYTGIIFEVKVPGFPVSIAGGGRYDNLIELYGGEPVPGTGFAIGLDRTLAAMQHLGRSPEALAPTRQRVAVVVMEEQLAPIAARLQDLLAEKGYTAVIHEEQKLSKLLPRLAKQGYHYAAIIGRREAEQGTVVIRDLTARRQVEVKLEDLEGVKALSELLA